ncbi:MAG: DoxX family protein [Flavobacteriaceae bacterium]
MSPIFLNILIIFSALSFLFFGYACLTSPFMVIEFKRYGLSRYRKINGYLQLAGGVALIGGFFFKPLALFGSAGLGILMLLGLLLRIRIKDSVLQSSPAFFYMLLNSFIFWMLYQNV